MLLEKGDAAAVSMRAIARAVGVTPPAIYLHFDDKDALIDEICNRRFGQLNATLDEAMTDIEDPIESLKAAGRAYIRFGVDNPEPYRVLMMTKSDRPHGEMAGREPTQGDLAFAKLVNMIATCIDAGKLRPMEPLDAAMVVWAGVHGLTSLLIATPEFGWPEHIIDLLLDSTIEGLAPRS